MVKSAKTNDKKSRGNIIFVAQIYFLFYIINSNVMKMSGNIPIIDILMKNKYLYNIVYGNISNLRLNVL